MKKLFTLLCFTLMILLFASCQKKINITISGENKIIKDGTTLSELNKPSTDLDTLDYWLVNGVKKDNTYKLKEGDKLVSVLRKKKFYTVKFEDVITPIQDQIVREDMLVQRPNNPIKKYFTFKEWQVDGKVFDFSKPITSDITIKASWISIGAPKTKVTIITSFLDEKGFLRDKKSEAEGYYVSDLPIPEQIPVNEKGDGGYYFGYWLIDGKRVDNSYELKPNDIIKAEYLKYPLARYALYKKEILNDPNVDYNDWSTYGKYYISDSKEYDKLESSFKYIQFPKHEILGYNYIDKLFVPKGHKLLCVKVLIKEKEDEYAKEIVVNPKKIDGVIYTEYIEKALSLECKITKID